jgi:hypothetical protein
VSAAGIDKTRQSLGEKVTFRLLSASVPPEIDGDGVGTGGVSGAIRSEMALDRSLARALAVQHGLRHDAGA